MLLSDFYPITHDKISDKWIALKDGQTKEFEDFYEALKFLKKD